MRDMRRPIVCEPLRSSSRCDLTPRSDLEQRLVAAHLARAPRAPRSTDARRRHAALRAAPLEPVAVPVRSRARRSRGGPSARATSVGRCAAVARRRVRRLRAAPDRSSRRTTRALIARRSTASEDDRPAHDVVRPRSPRARRVWQPVGAGGIGAVKPRSAPHAGLTPAPGCGRPPSAGRYAPRDERLGRAPMPTLLDRAAAIAERFLDNIESVVHGKSDEIRLVLTRARLQRARPVRGRPGHGEDGARARGRRSRSTARSGRASSARPTCSRRTSRGSRCTARQPGVRVPARARSSRTSSSSTRSTARCRRRSRRSWRRWRSGR